MDFYYSLCEFYIEFFNFELKKSLNNYLSSNYLKIEYLLLL